MYCSFSLIIKDANLLNDVWSMNKINIIIDCQKSKWKVLLSIYLTWLEATLKVDVSIKYQLSHNWWKESIQVGSRDVNWIESVLLGRGNLLGRGTVPSRSKIYNFHYPP